MNKKQLLERQITKQFLNESSLAGEKAKEALVGMGKYAISKFVPVADLADVALDLVDAARLNKTTSSLDVTGKNDEEQFLLFVKKLNDLTSSSTKLKPFKSEQGNRINFAAVINAALKGVLIDGKEYQLTDGVEGYATTTHKRPGYEK